MKRDGRKLLVATAGLAAISYLACEPKPVGPAAVSPDATGEREALSAMDSGVVTPKKDAAASADTSVGPVVSSVEPDPTTGNTMPPALTPSSADAGVSPVRDGGKGAQEVPKFPIPKFPVGNLMAPRPR
jgi:hypothetical protein